MANENNPGDPYDRDHLKDPTRTYIDNRRSPADIDNDLQVDPEMAEGPASNARIALFAVGIAIVLGVVFYGLNHTSTQQQASTAPIHNNTQPGTTTGAAPAKPLTPKPQPPSPAPTNPGGTAPNNANPGNPPASK
jgi:type IV secretory pathway VirB10-like protein